MVGHRDAFVTVKVPGCVSGAAERAAPVPRPCRCEPPAAARARRAQRPDRRDYFSAKLAIACSSVAYTSNTSDSLVMTKMFSMRLSTEESFICPPRRT